MITQTSRFRQARMLLLWESRPVTDAISWFVFFLLTIGFSTILLWFQYYDRDGLEVGQHFNGLLEFITRENGIAGESLLWIDAFKVILRNSLMYTLIMMLPVYLNLLFFKKRLLDPHKKRKWWGRLFYLLAVFLNALFFAGVLFLLLKAHPTLLRVKMSFPLNLLTIFGVQIISSGMLYRRQIIQLSRRLRRVENRARNAKEQLDTVLEKGLVEVSGNKQHLKIGKKNHFDIVAFDDILYLQGAGNEPWIFTTGDQKGLGKLLGSSRLCDYENFLPSDQFIRIHRSYIINKTKVVKRLGSLLYLQGLKDALPIGGKYEALLEEDDFLGFDWPKKEKLEKTHPIKSTVHPN